MEVGLAALRISVCTYATGSQVGGGVSHVQVLSPSLLGVPRRTTWGACWHARGEGKNGAMLVPSMGVFARQGQCGIKAPQMML